MIERGIFIQARLNSTRLPAKALLDFHGKTILERVIQRCNLTGLPTFLLTSTTRDDDALVDVAKRSRLEGIFRGDLNDVRSRFIEASNYFGISEIARVTSDNPLTEPIFIVENFNGLNDRDYCRINNDCCPVGLNSETFRTSLLQDSVKLLPLDKYNQEHVTPWMIEYQRNLKISPDLQSNLFSEFHNLSDYKFTIDTLSDYKRVRNYCHGLLENDFNSQNLMGIVLKNSQSNNY